jgi:hypothetical protein
MSIAIPEPHRPRPGQEDLSSTVSLLLSHDLIRTAGAASAQIVVVTGSLPGADRLDRIPDWPANRERTGEGVVDALEIDMFTRPATSLSGDEGLLILQSRAIGAAMLFVYGDQILRGLLTRPITLHLLEILRRR